MLPPEIEFVILTARRLRCETRVGPSLQTMLITAYYLPLFSVVLLTILVSFI